MQLQPTLLRRGQYAPILALHGVVHPGGLPDAPSSLLWSVRGEPVVGEYGVRRVVLQAVLKYVHVHPMHLKQRPGMCICLTATLGCAVRGSLAVSSCRASRDSSSRLSMTHVQSLEVARPDQQQA